MDAYSVFQACVRRWYVFAVLLAVTVGIAAVTYRSADATYSRTEAYLVASPTPEAGSGTPNPLTSTGNALAALVQRLNSPDIIEPVAAASSDATVIASSGESGSILQLTAEGPTPDATEQALQAYSAEAQRAFQDLQERVNASSSNFYQLVSLSAGELEANFPGRNQAVGLVAIGGLVLSALLTQLADVLLLRRARRADDMAADGTPALPTGTERATRRRATHAQKATSPAEILEGDGSSLEAGRTTERA